MPVFLSIDLGAGSGRVIAGISNQESFRLEEVHRFDNPGTDLPGGSFWNIVGLYRDIIDGLRRAVEEYGKDIVAIGIDTWGCDFGLIDAHGRLLGMPHQYRDARHEGMPAVMHQRMGEAEIYAQTGITTNFYNSSLHLLAEEQLGSPALAAADKLLFIPDLLAYWLCGVQAVERTIASTSQLLDAATGDWAWDVIGALKLPDKMFGGIVAPGTVLGPIRQEVARDIGMEGIPVVASASHDTASAVAGIPMEGDDPLWLSSGTWSIMGIETREPIRSPEAFAARCCNELGVEGSVRFLKNIAGLWLIQECKRQWSLDGDKLTFAEMAALAEAAPSFSAFIDPDDPVFAAPGEMPAKIQEWCRKTGQDVPQDKGTILRVATESLALKYRVVFENFCRLSGKRFTRLHAGGGGIQNEFLAQATADALGIEVVAGPIEATSCGNLIVQMIAVGHVADLAAGRELIRTSFEFNSYQPRNHESWAGAFERFQSVTGS
ncbi:rhamnulokinase [Luteolibacter marinus]|uniref:rhamnulokinase n=1 Tax=Luteolibacter marinus TaxID=2776705 RepID=UPI0018686BF5|nr:rhamnulokinase family protein [Luteolibacter marinus]